MLNCAGWHFERVIPLTTAFFLEDEAKQLDVEGKFIEADSFYIEAIVKYDELVKLEKSKNNPEPNYLSLILWYSAECYEQVNEFEQAIRKYEEAVPYLEQSLVPTVTAVAYMTIAMIYIKNLRDHDKSQENWVKAIRYSEKYPAPDDVVMSGKSMKTLALECQYFTYMLGSEWEEALHHLLYSLDFIEQLSDKRKVADFYNDIAESYDHLGYKKKALEFAEKEITIFRELVDGDTITYKDRKLLADGLLFISELRRKDKDIQRSIQDIEEAITIYEELGDLKGISDGHMAIGRIYFALSDVPKSIDYHLIAAENLKFLGNQEDYGYCLGWISGIYDYSGDHDRSIEYFNSALDIQLELSSDTSLINWFSLGDFYFESGDYRKAVINYETRFDHVENYFKEDPFAPTEIIEKNKAEYYQGIGNIYNAWGRHQNALMNYTSALKIYESYGDSSSISDIISEMGDIFLELGVDEKARASYERALRINQELGRRYLLAHSFKDLGEYYLAVDSTIMAMNYLDSALEVYKETASFHDIQGTLYSLGKANAKLGNYVVAENYFTEYIKYAEEWNYKPRLASGRSSLADIFRQRREYPEAIENYILAVNIFEELRKTATGETRREYFSQVVSIYENLTTSYLHYGDFRSAFDIIELSRAKLLVEQLAGSDSLVSISDLNQVQGSLSSNQAIVIYANVEQEYLIELVITNDTIIGVEVPDSILLSILYPDNKDATLQLAIKSYRNSIKFSTWTEKTTEFGRAFFDYLINPLSEHFLNKSDLLIIPDGILGYLPFEVLVDENGKYLMETHDIKYAQSVSIWDLIRNRKYDGRKGTLLAVGGAKYNPETYEVDMVESDKMLAYLEKTTFDSMSTRGSLNESYASLGYSGWSNLPGSLNEINSISTVIQYTDKISGDNATEDIIKELSLSGELSKYTMLHFATHGVMVPDIPELSAVVLSQFVQITDGEDGYLTMGEIAKLELKADFVNLSACETGLGKIYPGEGVVGLTQGFMLAGANSVSVSLWPIADEATSEFMVSVYSKIADGSSYSLAITETKRDFISGKYGVEYKKPYYWAPFVYYGNSL